MRNRKLLEAHVMGQRQRTTREALEKAARIFTQELWPLTDGEQKVVDKIHALAASLPAETAAPELFVDAIGEMESLQAWLTGALDAARKLRASAQMPVGFDEGFAAGAAQSERITLPEEVHTALLEAYKFGQFADDFNQPLAKPIRKAVRDLCDWLASLSPPNNEKSK